MQLLKRSAAIIVFSTMFIVVLGMNALVGDEWLPRLKKLETMSIRSAILVHVAVLIVVVGIIYVIFRP